MTPLHLVAGGQSSNAAAAEFLELLLINNADVNATDGNGRTPLHSATIQGYTAFALQLLARGADVNARTSKGETPLHFAAIGHNPYANTMGIAELLLDKGADVNAKTKDGQTPLSDAVSAGDTQLRKLLLQHGARQ